MIQHPEHLTEKQAEQVATEIARRAVECERGVIAVREDGLAAIAVVGPNSLLLSVCLTPEVARAGIEPLFADYGLN